MEIPIVLGIIALGYGLSQKSLDKKKTYKNENFFDNQTNIYENNRFDKVQSQNRNIISNFHAQSKFPIKTNVIPEQMSSNIHNNNNNSLLYLQRPENTRQVVQRDTITENFGNNVVSNLSGETMTKDEFKHNNMVPFFGSTIRQNTDQNRTSSILEHHTGVMENYTSKKEQAPLFKPTMDMGNVYGTQNQFDRELERYITSQKKTNELPFEKIMVGPGLNKGYGSDPSGGFHNPNTRDFILPKTIDELRVKNNPKITFEGRIISGKSINKRGQEGITVKNRPDTFFVNTPDRYNTTVGSYTKNVPRPSIYIKDTNRKITREYHGNAEAILGKKNKVRPKIRKSTKPNFGDYGLRNLGSSDKWINEEFGDYGKKTIDLKNTERNITGKRTHTSNITTLVKAIVTPVIDLMKTTRKQNVVGNIRQSGNLQMKVHKQTIYDPNDIARTTIKETNIHNNRKGNIAGPKKLMTYDPNDITRTTIKETNIHNNRKGNMAGPKKLITYDPNDIARTTIKETNIHNNRKGNIGGHQYSVVYDPNDMARTTHKETLVDKNRIGNIGIKFKKLPVKDPNDITKTTIKETNIHNERMGNLNSLSGSGKKIHNQKARNTNRQFTGDKEYCGNPDGDVGKGGGEGYLTSNYEAKNTQKQFTSDNEYSGTAKSSINASMSYNDIYNATLNEIKEGTLEGREPTTSNVSLNVGGETINIRTKKIDSDITNERDFSKTRIYNSIPQVNKCQVTKVKNQLDNDEIYDRYNPEILDAYKNNPYSKPLNSVA